MLLKEGREDRNKPDIIPPAPRTSLYLRYYQPQGKGLGVVFFFRHFAYFLENIHKKPCFGVKLLGISAFLTYSFAIRCFVLSAAFRAKPSKFNHLSYPRKKLLHLCGRGGRTYKFYRYQPKNNLHQNYLRNLLSFVDENCYKTNK